MRDSRESPPPKRVPDGLGRIRGVTRAQGDAEAPEKSVSQDHFIGMYEAKTDPWDTATKWHDRRKYAVTVASLPRERYRRCYEPGCSVGLLTRLLAPRCDEILAVDAVPGAVRAAAEEVREFPHVRVEPAMLPADLPEGTFDLIVIGDLLYYLSAGDLAALLDGLAERLEPGGDFVSVHFRDRESGNYDGFNAHQALTARTDLEPVIHHDDEWFVLDVLRRV
jgi:SAM-dependent methyltransferase